MAYAPRTTLSICRLVLALVVGSLTGCFTPADPIELDGTDTDGTASGSSTLDPTDGTASGGEGSCSSDGDCDGATPVCNQQTGECVECLDSAADCTAPNECNPLTNTCAPPCSSDADCPAITPACAQELGVCVECLGNSDCASPTPACAPTNECVECVGNNDCGALTPICSDANSCVECIGDEDCDGLCDPGTSTCVAASCVDGMQNSGETDLDCGGPCPPCGVGDSCGEPGDCETDNCENGVCVQPVCPAATHACMPAIPANWTGPALLSAGNEAPGECGASYPTSPTLGQFGLDWDPASCTCECDNESMCGDTVRVGWHPNCADAINGAEDIAVLDPGVCTEINAAVPRRLAANTQEDFGQPCPEISMSDIGPVSWTGDARLCEGATLLTGCERDELCVPQADAGYEGGYCIYRAGDLDCPTGFDDRTVLFDDFSDTRDCSTCECGNVAAIQCNATVRLSNNPSCSSPYATLDEATQNTTNCPSLGVSPNYVRVDAIEYESGGCTPSGGESQGTVVGTGAITVCCT